LSQDDKINVVGEARQPEELFRTLEEKEVDILLLDIYLDGMKEVRVIDGFEVCRTMQAKYPKVKIIAHSVYDDADRVARIMNAGAMGFVSKKAGYEELIDAIKQVCSGQNISARKPRSGLRTWISFCRALKIPCVIRTNFSRNAKERCWSYYPGDFPRRKLLKSFLLPKKQSSLTGKISSGKRR
jgi:DNA-binding NarL/FixJ family response regulator